MTDKKQYNGALISLAVRCIGNPEKDTRCNIDGEKDLKKQM